MPHKYILDSSVVLSDPRCIYKFNKSDVLVPLKVIEEIENFKSQSSAIGKNAREFLRALDKLRLIGSLVEGIPTESGGSIRVVFSSKELVDKLPHEFSRDLADNIILAIAFEHKGVIVSNDLNLRIKSSSLGLDAESYEAGKVDSSDSYDGHDDVMVSGEQLAEFFSGGLELEGYYENQCLTLYAEHNLNQTGLGIFKDGVVRPLSKDATNGVSKIRPLNREQSFAIALLLDDSVPLVTIDGRAGCGKSILSLAVGLAKIQEGIYNRMMIAKPTIAMGGSHNEIGWLPGSKSEKLEPWLTPVRDNLDIIAGIDNVRNKSKRSLLDDFQEQGIIEAESLGFLRGRSLQKQWIYIDECQNISKAECKTLLTRIAEGSKLIMCGDRDQIDSPYLDAQSNGLATIIHKFRESKLASHITLKKGVRSPLSEEASRLL